VGMAMEHNWIAAMEGKYWKQLQEKQTN
jgi:hypothetical protein